MIIGIDACPLVEQRTGIGNFTYALVDWLAAAKPQAKFILYSNSPIHFPQRTNVVQRPLSTRRRGALWHQTRLAPELRRDSVDLFWGTNGYLPLWLPRRIRMVLTVHDLVWHRAGGTMPTLSYWSRRLFQPPAIRAADAVVAVSHATSDDVRATYGRIADAVVYPVADARFQIASLQEQRRVQDKLELQAPYLLAVGTLEPRKNYSLLVRAYRRACDLGLQLPNLVIAGGKGWLDEELRRELAHEGNRGRVRAIGFVADDDMCGLYSGACALIQPSVYEGFGLPVLEAQLCGTPVLIADLPSLREAAGDVAVRFAPTADGLHEMLIRLAEGRLPIVCRAPAGIRNSVAESGESLWRVFEGATERNLH